MTKRYEAIFFDWDGTAVTSRSTPANKAAAAMRPLLKHGIKLCVVSGTTYENIAGGRLHEFFTAEERQNLFFGLARGAQNFGFNKVGELTLLGGVQPERETLLILHAVCFEVHKQLFRDYGINTDLVFHRPNYCKIDLLSGLNRGDRLFFQTGEALRLGKELETHGFKNGLSGLASLAEQEGKKRGLSVKATTDAKYLEVGLTTKSDNVDFLMDFLKLCADTCCFLGDEFLEISDGVFGSDAQMITEKTRGGDFFDVSEAYGRRPRNVTLMKGGVESFRSFLADQNENNAGERGKESHL